MKEPAWYRLCRNRATNPKYPNEIMGAIAKALRSNHPDMAYIHSKIKVLEEFCTNTANFGQGD